MAPGAEYALRFLLEYRQSSGASLEPVVDLWPSAAKRRVDVEQNPINHNGLGERDRYRNNREHNPAIFSMAKGHSVGSHDKLRKARIALPAQMHANRWPHAHMWTRDEGNRHTKRPLAKLFDIPSMHFCFFSQCHVSKARDKTGGAQAPRTAINEKMATFSAKIAKWRFETVPHT